MMRTQAVSPFGQISCRLPVSRSIIQGSGIGPYLYLVYASDLRTLFLHNVVIKYADDTTLLVGQHSSMDIIPEYDNICVWSARNKLTINTDKTKEIIFHRPASRHLNIPPPMPDIERVTQAALLGIDITSTLSTAAYVNRMLLQINQRLYLHSSSRKAWQFKPYISYLLVLSCLRSHTHCQPLQDNLPLTTGTG